MLLCNLILAECLEDWTTDIFGLLIAGAPPHQGYPTTSAMPPT